LRHVAWVVVLSGGLAAVLPGRTDPETDRFSALAHALQRRGLVVAPEDAQWVDRPGGPIGGAARAIVRAAPAKGEPCDIFLVETRLTPEGVLLSVGNAYNLTETSGADESRPVIRGQRVAYVARPLLAEVASTVHVIDLGGHPPLQGWSGMERAQNA